MNYLGPECNLKTWSQRVTVVCDVTLWLPFYFLWKKRRCGYLPGAEPLRASVGGECPEMRSLLQAVLKMRWSICWVLFVFVFFSFLSLLPTSPSFSLFLGPSDYQRLERCFVWSLIAGSDPAQKPFPAAVAPSGGWRPLETSDGFLKASCFPIAVQHIMLLLHDFIGQTELGAVHTKLCSFRY